MRLTLLEMKREYDFRIAERVAILCGTGPATPEAIALGTADADAWLESYAPKEQTQGVLL